MISKISLGTVQFGQHYGIANTRGQVPKNEALEILDYATGVGINNLDTAFAYGESELIIGEYLAQHKNSFKIVSKLPSLEPYRAGKIEAFLEQSFKSLKVERLYGYLLHRFNDILVSDDVWNDLVRLKRNGSIEKIGFSLYSPDELIFLLDHGVEFDILQVPYSIFDRRFEEYFGLLNQKKVEIQARSIFLQGLAFLNSDELPESVEKAKDSLKILKNLSEKANIPINALCLNFVLLNSNIDHAVIGVDSLSHLKSNVEDLRYFSQVEALKESLTSLAIDDEDILLPYRWSRA